MFPPLRLAFFFSVKSWVQYNNETRGEIKTDRQGTNFRKVRKWYGVETATSHYIRQVCFVSSDDTFTARSMATDAATIHLGSA